MPAPRKDKERFSHLGPRFRALTKFHGIPHEELAALLDCNTAFISHLLCGRKLLPAHKLQRLAKLLQVTPDQLLGTEDLTITKTLNLPKI